MFGKMCPIWAVILIEFVFAYGLACVPELSVCLFQPALLHSAACPDSVSCFVLQKPAECSNNRIKDMARRYIMIRLTVLSPKC